MGAARTSTISKMVNQMPTCAVVLAPGSLSPVSHNLSSGHGVYSITVMIRPNHLPSIFYVNNCEHNFIPNSIKKFQFSIRTQSLIITSLLPQSQEHGSHPQNQSVFLTQHQHILILALVWVSNQFLCRNFSKELSNDRCRGSGMPKEGPGSML